MSLFLKFLFILCLLSGQTFSQIGKKGFYEYFSSSDEKAINMAIELVNKSKIKEGTAYMGALLMRKAGIVSPLKEKLDLFKQGRKKLEGEIEKESNNAEYRFLRLMVQENAPLVLGYKQSIKADKQLIISQYHSMDAVVKIAILNYTKTSKILTKEDFQN